MKKKLVMILMAVMVASATLGGCGQKGAERVFHGGGIAGKGRCHGLYVVSVVWGQVTGLR